MIGGIEQVRFCPRLLTTIGPLHPCLALGTGNLSQAWVGHGSFQFRDGIGQRRTVIGAFFMSVGDCGF